MLNTLRWQSLQAMAFPYGYVKNYLKSNYEYDIIETNYNDFNNVIQEKYPLIDEDEVLFYLEDIAFKKVALFLLRDKELEELNNAVFREQFIQGNRIANIINKKKIDRLDETLYPCYVSFDQRYAVIKFAQLRTYTIGEADENNVVTDVEKTYYHCNKLVIDLYNGIASMFYNDINNEGEDGITKGKAITEKKQAFYNLFVEGNQNTLLKFSLDEYLNKYIKEYLNCLNTDRKENCKSVVVIETSDPVESKNNLRSSKKDGRHNEYRLSAIKYALENEEHTVKLMECIIDGRWFQFKNQGEIMTNVPHFSREVIKSVCEKIFPGFKIYEDGAIV